MRVMLGADTQIAWGEETTYGGSPPPTIDQWFGYGDRPHTAEESYKGYEPYRYVGGANRNVDTFLQGTADFTGTLNFMPQRGFLWWFALGKCVCSGSPSTPITHTITESGTLPSFAIEDAQEVVANEHLKRTYVGCKIDSLTLRCREGGRLEQEVTYAAKTVYLSSGTMSSVTAGSDNPYFFDECLVKISGGGVHGDCDSMREFEWTINNNLDIPRYLDNTVGIGDPIPGNRDYSFTATLSATAGSAEDWYEKYFYGGSNINIDLYVFRTSGTDDVHITMSGCKMLDCDQPSTREGTILQTWTVQPQSCSIIVRDDTVTNGTNAYKA
jgi:hypothetical protein